MYVSVYLTNSPSSIPADQYHAIVHNLDNFARPGVMTLHGSPHYLPLAELGPFLLACWGGVATTATLLVGRGGGWSYIS